MSFRKEKNSLFQKYLDEGLFLLKNRKGIYIPAKNL